ncbi:MAG: hypothetical protein GY940_29440 [bacterium]|nr:hypothetical protein [bacterium]
MIKKSGWTFVPAVFFLFLNFSVSSAKTLFISRLAFFLFLLFLFLVLRNVSLKKILQPMVAGVSFIVFLYGIMQKFVLFPIYLSRITPDDNFYTQAFITRIKGGRIFSIFVLPTLYAIICTVLILFIFHYMVTTAKTVKQRLLWGVLLLAGLVNLVLTQSFGGVLYLTVGGLLYLLLSGILKLKYLAPVIMVLSLFLSLTIALRFAEVKELEPVKLRYSNWKQAARIIEANPFWGAGLGNYESNVARYTYRGEAKSIYAHNFFLQFPAETGIVIPVILLILLWLMRKKLKPVNYKEKALYITVGAVLIFYNLIDIGFYFFPAGVISAVVLSQIYPAQEEKRKTGSGFHAGMVFPMAALVVLSLVLGMEALSENQRKEADFLVNTEKDYAGAGNLYKKSIGINPFNFKAMIGYASLPVEGEKAAEAERILDRALKLNPDSAFAAYLKSRFQFKRGHYLSALYYAAEADEKNPRIHNYKQWRKYVKNSLEAGFDKQEKK